MMLPAGPLLATTGFVAAAGELVTGQSPFGYLGPVALAAMGAFTLWHSGALRAWKETAAARDERIGDLERELAELRSELAIPERIEGLVRLMSESAERAESRSADRVAVVVDRIEKGFGELSRVVRESSPTHP